MSIFNFKFKGGVFRHNKHYSEKFLLYFLAGGKEISFYELRNANILKKNSNIADHYKAPFNICKIFLSVAGFGIPRKFYSFYFQIVEKERTVTIKPFSLDKTGFYFTANGNFLNTTQVKEHLSNNSDSYKFLKIQDPLPVEILRSMITIDYGDPLNGIRKIREVRK